MAEDRATVRVSKKTMSIIEEIAEERECSAGEACDQMIGTAWGRLQAVRKDSARRAAGKKPFGRKPKKAKKAKAKKVAKKAVAKTTTNGAAAAA